MSRLSGPKRKKLYEQLVRRDGECCFIGGERGNYNTLVIDHLDNDNSNNCLSQLHLLCHSMNSFKNLRGRTRKQSFVCVSVSQELVEEIRTNSAEVLKNWQSEPDFRHWLFMEIWRKGLLELNEAIDCGAAVARCSQETIKRYIRKEANRIRPYQLIEDGLTKTKSILFRPEWEQARRKEAKRREVDQQARNWEKFSEENRKIHKM